MSKKNSNIKPSDIPGKPDYRKPVKPMAPSAKLSLTSGKYLPGIMVLLLFLILSLMYFPVAYQHKAPIAQDITQWEGGSHTIVEYNKTHGDKALWTQNMFSGMPAYMISFPNRFPYLESITKLTDKVINWRIFLLFIGGLGIFVLLRFCGMDPWIAMFGAVTFVFSCHWVGLVEIGHNTKFRAIMYVPWVMWAVMYLRKNPNLLGLGLVGTFLITQLRENHPQITYYLYLFVGMYWIYSLIETFSSKEWKRFAIFSLLLLMAFGLTVLAVMNPYLSTMEYSHFTMRGGDSGLDKAYAQGWSFHPWEILTFVIPDFFGGITTTPIPNMPQGIGPYWGWMDFTQIYNYFGLIVLALGIMALLGKHRKFSIFIWISSVIFTVMSFGKFAPTISDLLLKYLPYFNKFRVPSMILVMVQINAVVLAALGLDTIIDRTEKGDTRFSNALFRAFWIIGGIFLAYALLARTFFKGLPFTTEREIKMFTDAGATSLLEQLKTYRLGLLAKSGIISLLLLTLATGASYLFSARKFKRNVFIMAIMILSLIDLGIYTSHYLQDNKPASEHRDYFAMKDYDEFLNADPSNYRIYPTGVGPAGDWAYHHQTVDGYSAAKLKRYDDLLRRDLHPQFSRYKEVWEQYGLEAPTQILDMLSTKYIILSDTLRGSSYLQQKKLVFESSYTPVRIYQNNTALPRAWFVQNVQQISPADSILPQMNSLDFNPAVTAYVETPIKGIGKPQVSLVSQTTREIQRLAYNVETDTTSFLVLSEIYYPAGWKAYLDGKEIPIYAANYVLRGLVIPAGKHKLELKFAPASYHKGIQYSGIGLLLTLLALAGGLFLHKRKGNKIEL